MEALKANGLHPRRVITWRKNNAVPINRAHMPMSATEYIIVGVKKGNKSTFNADVPISGQTAAEKIVEANIVADKVSTIVFAKIKDKILQNEHLPNLTAQEHLAEIERTVREALQSSAAEIVVKTEKMYKENEKNEKYLQACVPNYIQNALKTGNRLHPTEKPVHLLQYLIALYTETGDTVLDGFGGSGSTGEAALTLGRNVIIVERDKSFYENLVRRLTPLADAIQMELNTEG
jgi:DNA modification methylase